MKKVKKAKQVPERKPKIYPHQKEITEAFKKMTENTKVIFIKSRKEIK